MRVFHFLKNYFSSEGCVTDEELLHVIPEIITPEDSYYLTAIPDQDEVWICLLRLQQGLTDFL